jgi:hypothetical protein
MHSGKKMPTARPVTSMTIVTMVPLSTAFRKRSVCAMTFSFNRPELPLLQKAKRLLNGGIQQ